MLHFWFNTFFVGEEEQPEEQNGQSFHKCHSGSAGGPLLTLTLAKSDLDRANKDKLHKLFSPNFKVKFICRICLPTCNWVFYQQSLNVLSYQLSPSGHFLPANT